MPQRTRPSRPDPKVEALRVDGALNRHADQITDPVFGAHQFFDARDLVQVKYEMLRRVEIDTQPVTPTAAAFRLSRPSFYQAQRAFQQRGLAGLLPKKRGPHGGHKLTAEIVTVLQSSWSITIKDCRARPPSIGPGFKPWWPTSAWAGRG